MKKLCVLGSLHLDLLINAPRLPKTDETIAGQKVTYKFGGKGGNQAIAASRQGCQVYFIGKVGNDSFGQKLKDGFINTSVDTSQILTDSGNSGMSVAILEDSGQYGALIVSEANSRIRKEDIHITENSGILLMQNEIPEDINIYAAKKAKQKGCEVWLNAAPSRALNSELLSLLDVIIINRVESDFYGSFLLLNPTKKLTKITTFGQKGVQVVLPTKEPKHFPAFPVKIVSAHGAGDVFIGAMAAKRLAGSNFYAAINFAHAAAALHVATPLENTSSITNKDILKFMSEN